MDSRWLKGIPEEDKEARRKEFLSYRTAFEALRELLVELEETPESPDYNSAGWAYHAADIAGANRKLRQVLKLIDHKEKTDHV